MAKKKVIKLPKVNPITGKTTKRGTLSKDDKGIIERNRSKGMEYLLKRTRKSELLITRYLEYLDNKPEPKTEIELHQSLYIEPEVEVKAKVEEVVETKPLKPYELFGRNERHGAVVMTEAASMLSDATKAKNQPKHDPSIIHTIRANKK